MGLIALLLARHGKATDTRTFGWHRAEVFTAVANAVLLIGVAGFVLYEAIERIGSDPQVPGLTLIVVALVGLTVNVLVMFLLRADSQESIAVRGATSRCWPMRSQCRGTRRRHRGADHRMGLRRHHRGRRHRAVGRAACLRLAVDALRILNQQAPTHSTSTRCVASCPRSPRSPMCTTCTSGR